MKTDAVMMTTLVLAFSAAVVPEARADFFDAKQGLSSLQFLRVSSLFGLHSVYFIRDNVAS